MTHGTGGFELEVPDAAEMARRRDDVLAKGLPWLVAERGGEVLGYAYVGVLAAAGLSLQRRGLDLPASPGPGRWRRSGAARRLMARCQAAGARQMLAVIGDSPTPARSACTGRWASSTAAPCSRGWKFGRWLDVVLMQRSAGRRRGRTGMTQRSKTVATWLVIPGGTLGLHRFTCTAGATCGLAALATFDRPTASGVQRMRAFGQDDHVAGC